MKMRMAALAAAFVSACAWGQATQNVHPMDPCAGRQDNASCTEPSSGKAGTCRWLAPAERDRMKIRTQSDCRAKGMHAGACHTCVTAEQMSAIGATGDAKKTDGKPAETKY